MPQNSKKGYNNVRAASISMKSGEPRETVRRIARKTLVRYSYRGNPSLALNERTRARRVAFCTWALGQFGMLLILNEHYKKFTAKFLLHMGAQAQFFVDSQFHHVFLIKHHFLMYK